MLHYNFSNFNLFFQKKSIKSYFQGIGKEFLLFSMSTIIFQTSRFIVAMIVARWVGPAQYGIWNSLQPLLAYGVIFFCGIPNGMNREVPYLMGRGETIKAQKFVNFAILFVFCAASLIGIIIILMSFVFNIPDHFKLPVCFAGILYMPMNMYVLFQFLLKSRIQFKAMSIQQFLFSFFYPIFTLICAFFGGISGFIFGQSLTALIMVPVIYRLSPFQIKMEFVKGSFKRLSRVGLPLMSAGLLYVLLTTVDRWVILTYLGVKDLGQYTVAILIFGVLSIVPVVISQQMYPRMAYRYGVTRSFFSLFPMIVKQSLSAFTVTLPIIACAYILIPFFVSEIMPQYSEGIYPARILLIGLVFLPLAGGVANFLNTIDKQFYYMLVQAVAILIKLAFAILFVNIGWGLKGVAWAGATTYFLYTIFLCFTGFMIVMKKIRHQRDIHIPA